MPKTVEATDPTWLMGLSGYFNGQTGLANICSVINANSTSLNLFRFSFAPNWKGGLHAYNSTAIQYILDNTNATLVIDRNHLYPPGSTSDADAVAHWTSGVVAGIYEVLEDFGENPRVYVELINEYTASDFDTRMQALITTIRNDGYTNYLVADRMWPFSWSVWNDPLNKTYQGFHHYANERSLTQAISRMEDARDAGIDKIMNTETGAHYSEYGSYTQPLVDQIEAFYNWSYSLANPIFNCLWMRENIENWNAYNTTYNLNLPVMPPPPVLPPTSLPPYLLNYTTNTTYASWVCNFTASWNSSIGLDTGWLTYNSSGSWLNLTQALTGTEDTSFNQTIILPAVAGTTVAYYLGANATDGNYTQSDLLTLVITAYSNPILVTHSISTTIQYETAYFYANWTAIEGLSRGWLTYTFNGSSTTLSMALSGTTDEFNMSFVLPIEGIYISATFYANDTYNYTTSHAYSFFTTAVLVPVTPEGFRIEMLETTSIEFQLEPGTDLKITAYGGEFNTNDTCVLIIDNAHGLLTFDLPNQGYLTFLWEGNVTGVTVNSALVGNGRTQTFLGDSSNSIAWSWYLSSSSPSLMQPYLPITFILGMIGLGSLIGGTTYGGIKLKNREIDHTLLFALFLTGAGYALFISWLWPAVGAMII